jgi:TM2 domain-containing membrane protein YozV
MFLGSHSLLMGYLLWIFGFMGAHRFYYGRPVSGVIYFCTLGLFFIGWIVDLFLMPKLDAEADRKFEEGIVDYNVAWICLTFLGVFGIHRLYLGKYWTAALYFFTGGLLMIGVIYDYLTLNDQIDELNWKFNRS